MTTTADLPQPGETILTRDGQTLTVAWCSGWTWPLGEPTPTRLYAQPMRGDTLIPTELRVVAARDAEGRRFWITERRMV